MQRASSRSAPARRRASLLRPGSALSRLNRDGRLDRPDPHLVALTRFALGLAAASGGAFDPTVQPLWPLWAEATAAGRRPSDVELRHAVPSIDWRAVEVSDDRIAFGRPGMAMTLNGLLQGYAADRVIAATRRLGVTDAFVDTGEFGAYGGHPDGRPWRLDGADPETPGGTRVIADPFTGFASTSAGAGTPFLADGRDNHIFDPATGRSPLGLASVTAFTPSGLVADGLSTAAIVLGRGKAEVLGRGKAEALAATYPGSALILT